MRIELIARNIVNQEYIEEFFNELYDKAKFKEIKDWINKQLRKYIQDKIDTVKLFTKLEKNQPQWLQDSIKNKDAFEVYFKPRFKNEVKHIIDYFNSLDDKELSKIYNLKFEVSIDKSRKWTIELNKETGDWDDFKGIEIVRKYKKGVKWVRVFSKQACEREGKVMDHCVGGYYKDVRDGLTSIYSLRDGMNKPHCTIEVKNGGVEQIKGYRDGKVKQQYVKYVLNFIEKPIFNKEFKFFKELSNAWLWKDKKTNKITIFENNYNLARIIDGNFSSQDLTTPFKQKFLHVKGSLYLDNYIFDYIPETLVVDKNLYLGNSKITELPDNLTIGGTLYLEKSNILSLPSNIKVKNINIENCILRELPNNLTVNDLTIGDNVKLTYLPKNLTVNRIFDLGDNTTITDLPKDIKLNGKVRLNKIIQTFPSINIGGNLVIHGKTKLPENLVVGYDFYYSTMYNDQASMPKNMTVNGLYYVHELQKELPENLIVNRLIFSGKTKIKSLPKTIKVKELVIRDNDLSLPDNMQLDELSISIDDNNFKLPKNLTVKELNLHNSTEFISLPDDLKADSIFINEYFVDDYADIHEKFHNNLYIVSEDGDSISLKEYEEYTEYL